MKKTLFLFRLFALVATLTCAIGDLTTPIDQLLAG